jgi:LysM repeat protein
LCVVAAGLLLTSGCGPSDSSQQDDEKEPHYVLGKGRVNAMDYEGAVEAFKQSLEVNPRSASAHFQLACLFDTRAADPASAIYHYQEFLRLNPKADNAEVVRQRIYSCKQQLAADVLPLPSTPAAQKQLENLAETNRLLQTQIAQLNESVRQWSEYAASLQAGRPANPTALRLADDTTASAGGISSGATTRQTTTTPTAARSRTHVVAAGDTLASIARKHGVSLTTLQAANPGVTPKKLKVGQTLNLPGQ